MMQIRIKRNYNRFTAGEVINHHDVVAEAWIRRGIAERYDGNTAAPAVPAVAPPPAIEALAPVLEPGSPGSPVVFDSNEPTEEHDEAGDRKTKKVNRGHR